MDRDVDDRCDEPPAESLVRQLAVHGVDRLSDGRNRDGEVDETDSDCSADL